MNSTRTRYGLWHSLTALLVLGLLPLPLFGLAVSPGLALVQNIPLGQEVNLGDLGFHIYGHNDSDEAQSFSFQPQAPSGTWGRDWEAGYEAFPDVSWCHMSQTVVEAQPKEKAPGDLILSIPDKPENYNRKWVLCVLVKRAERGTALIGAGMAIAIRLMIETVTSDTVDGVSAGPLAFVPGTITLSGKPGEKFDFTVKLRNNSGNKLTCQVERLNQIYSKPHKYARYTTSGFEALLQDSWTKALDETFSLEADTVKSFKLTGTIPATVDAGKKFEELVFVRGTGPVNGDDGVEGLAAMTFLRIRYLIDAGGPEQPHDESPQPQESAPPK